MPAKTPDRPRIFLNNVHLKGFKSIEDLSIDFQKGLNILIGKNGSGKSNFLEFLYEAIGLNRNDKPLFNYAKFDFVADDGHSFVLELDRELHTKIARLAFDNRNGFLEKFFIDDEIVFDNSNDEYLKNPIRFENKIIPIRGSIKNKLTTLFVLLEYKYWHPLHVKFDLPGNLECIKLPGTMMVNLENPFINLNYPETLGFINILFENVGAFYADEVRKLKEITATNVLEYLKIQDEIIENLQLYTTIEDVRFASNINLYSTDKAIIIENIKLEFKLNGNWLPWSQLSDGTKRLFYIISEVTNSNGLVLIEEPELGIHPHQFNLLMNFLKEQSEYKQIIISTHSPKALDHLSQDELNSILITYYDLKKGTQIRHLTDKETKKAKKYMKEVGFFSDYWLLSDLEE